ncbi:b(0,+)-type amino acid transporter 1 [Exaiptasia diaphana]|nr:b(0,+)-type amino acid transporter 1 [Exaiptasia diaphana]
MEESPQETMLPSQENLEPFIKSTTAEEGNKEQVGLKRTLGVPGGVALLVGTIIGSGIFATPRWIMMYAGSVGLNLVIWSVCGIFALCGGLCYLELGTLVPKSGGEYVYILEAFGSLPAFLYSWLYVMFLKPTAVMILLPFGAYILEPFFPGCSGREDLVPLIKLLAAAALGIITFVNCASVKWAARMQIVFTAAKMIAIVMLIVTGIVRIAQGHTSSFANAFEGSTTSLGLVGFAFYNGLYAYDGWNHLNYFTEEIKQPNRNLPVCIWIGIPLVSISYILVNIGYLAVLSSQELMTSNAVAVTVSDRMYGAMAWTIPVLVACSCFGGANGASFGGGRLLFASAREGHMPSFLAMVHTKNHTPLPAMLFNVWTGIPCFMLLISIYLVVAPFYQSPIESMYCIVATLSGVPVYFVFVYYKAVPKCIMDRYDKMIARLQTLLDVALPTEQQVFHQD